MKQLRNLLIAGLASAAVSPVVAPVESRERSSDVAMVKEKTREGVDEIMRRIRLLEDQNARLRKDVDELRSKLTIEDLHTAVRQASDSVFRVNAVQGEHGSGFVVAIRPKDAGKNHDPEQTYFLTCGHVAKEKKQIRAASVNEETTFSLVLQDASVDMALYSRKGPLRAARGLPLHDEAIDSRAMSAGLPVVAVGYTKSTYKGLPTFLSNEPDVREIWGRLPKALRIVEYPVVADTTFGYSGSPVVAPRVSIVDGKRTVETPVIAATNAVHTGRDVAVAIDYREIRDFLMRAGILKETRKQVAPGEVRGKE